LYIIDLSNFYLDVLKDRMYTFAPTSHERRSAQTVLWRITEALVRLVAPILSFTADEVWDYLPKVEGREKSVHLAQFPEPEEVFADEFTESFKEWKILFRARDVVLKHLEEARKNKEIGKALEADIQITSSSEINKILSKYESSLKELFNVSKVDIVGAIFDQKTLEVISNLEDNEICTQFHPATGTKCARCWNFMPEVGSYGIWQNVCKRCVDALKEMKIAPPVETV